MRESAYWLANKGRKKDAVEILAYIENQATGKITPRDPNALVVPPAAQNRWSPGPFLQELPHDHGGFMDHLLLRMFQRIRSQRLAAFPDAGKGIHN